MLHIALTFPTRMPLGLMPTLPDCGLFTASCLNQLDIDKRSLVQTCHFIGIGCFKSLRFAAQERMAPSAKPLATLLLIHKNHMTQFIYDS